MSDVVFLFEKLLKTSKRGDLFNVDNYKPIINIKKKILLIEHPHHAEIFRMYLNRLNTFMISNDSRLSLSDSTLCFLLSRHAISR